MCSRRVTNKFRGTASTDATDRGSPVLDSKCGRLIGKSHAKQLSRVRLGSRMRRLLATDLSVTGTALAHLDGRYLRNGPNPIAEVGPVAYHWSLGDGMVHWVRLHDRRAQWCRNRWLRSPGVADRLCEPVPGRRARAPIASLGANTNVIAHARPDPGADGGRCDRL